MAEFVKVCEASELAPGAMEEVEVNGVRVALCNVDGTFYAVRDECSHEEFPLSAGELEGRVVTCALHGAQFDVSTGRVRALPATSPVTTYPVKVENGAVYVAAE